MYLSILARDRREQRCIHEHEQRVEPKLAMWLTCGVRRQCPISCVLEGSVPDNSL